jgi:hypothetical protein
LAGKVTVSVIWSAEVEILVDFPFPFVFKSIKEAHGGNHFKDEKAMRKSLH